jgi:4'-phosphopantetheinyl transferase
VLEIVLARLDVDPAALPPLAMLLSADEVARAERFRLERDRRRFVVARATLRRLLGERLSRDPQGLRFVYGPHGKPALEAAELRFNLSHSGELALYAFSAGRDVGIDVEAVRAVPEAERIAREWFPEADYRRFGFLGCWTRKEALAKALGRGIADGPVDASGWSVHGFSPAPGYVAALARRIH